MIEIIGVRFKKAGKLYMEPEILYEGIFSPFVQGKEVEVAVKVHLISISMKI